MRRQYKVEEKMKYFIKIKKHELKKRTKNGVTSVILNLSLYGSDRGFSDIFISF